MSVDIQVQVAKADKHHFGAWGDAADDDLPLLLGYGDGRTATSSRDQRERNYCTSCQG